MNETATISASEANQKFSELLRRVQQGQRVTITSRGKPIATMAPVEPEGISKDAIEQLIAFSKKQPVRYSGDWKREDLYER